MKKHLKTGLKATIIFHFMLVFTSVLACERNDLRLEDEVPIKDTVKYERPIGEAIGEAVYEFIGPEGGSIQSSDGKVKIFFPEGALLEEQEIAIQPLENSSPGGSGFSYRFTPENIKLQKEVTITFNLEGQSQQALLSKTLEIAYQNEAGIWICPGKNEIDLNKKELRVLTDHFSDWSMIETMHLTPNLATLGLSESLELAAIQNVHPVDGDLLVPLVQPTNAGTPIPLSQTYIKNWKLDGPGRLVVNGNKAKYFSPSSKPAKNIATVTVELNVRGHQVILISEIHIIEDGIMISLDGGEWKTYLGAAGKVPGTNFHSMNNIVANSTDPQITFIWPSSALSNTEKRYSWSMFNDGNQQVTFAYFIPGLSHVYSSVYKEEQDFKDSPGYFTVKETEENGKKYISGIFVIESSGYFRTAITNEQVRIGNVRGIYRVPRGW